MQPDSITAADKNGKPFTAYKHYDMAQYVADKNSKADTDWNYKVAMTPFGYYAIAVIDEDNEFLGFL